MGHASHSHDGSSFAGVYYVRTNKEEEAAAGGALRVNDPRHIRLGGGALRGIGASDRVLRPRPGQLAFWPAFLQHEVTPTAGARARISFAMDLRVPGLDAFASPDAVWPQRLDDHGAAPPPRTPPAPQPAADVPPEGGGGAGANSDGGGHPRRPDEHVRCTPGCASSSCASLGAVPGADPGRLLTLAQECGACGPAQRCHPAHFTPLQSGMLRERLAGRTSREVFVKYSHEAFHRAVVADAAEEPPPPPLLPDDATDDADGAFTLKPFLCEGMPQWMRHAITSFSGDGVEVRGSADGAVRRACPRNGPPLPEQPPANDTGEAAAAAAAAARPVASERDLGAADFYRRYARPGVPVLLRGALLDPAEAAPGRAEAIRECCAREYAHKAGVARAEVAKAGAAASKKCDIYDPHTWCERSVQLCGRHPEFACATEAGALHDARRLPAPLRRLFEGLPAPLPSLERITKRFHEAYIFWSRPADTFGGPDHFDVICTGTLSMQHRGRKRWTLWAPWELTDADGGRIPAHTRFEVVASAGDVLYYPPAWFHGTVVEEEGGGSGGGDEEEEGGGGSSDDESISVAVDLEHVPAYGNLAGRSLRTPFGYGSCAAGANGWHAQSRTWDDALLGAEQREDDEL